MTPKNFCVPRDVQLQAAMFRLGKMEDEIQSGYEILRKYQKTVTIFGSARTDPNSAYYHAAKETAERLAKLGYAIVSGGGHGIMGAANEGANKAVQEGARAAGGESIAFNIRLPHEQEVNKYATEVFEFQHFAPRKIVMTMFANAYIYFPGGFGTLDELAEILTLIQTEKANRAPVILFDTAFWSDLDAFFRNHMLAEGAIVDKDLDIYTITDSVDEIIELVQANKTYC